MHSVRSLSSERLNLLELHHLKSHSKLSPSPNCAVANGDTKLQALHLNADSFQSIQTPHTPLPTSYIPNCNSTHPTSMDTCRQLPGLSLRLLLASPPVLPPPCGVRLRALHVCGSLHLPLPSPLRCRHRRPSVGSRAHLAPHRDKGERIDTTRTHRGGG